MSTKVGHSLTVFANSGYAVGMDLNEWLARISANDDGKPQSVNAIAKKSGLPQSTLNGRIKDGELTADQVIAICRAYGYDVVRGLLELGFIEENELVRPIVKIELETVPDEDIMREVLRRLQNNREQHPLFTEPMSFPSE